MASRVCDVRTATAFSNACSASANLVRASERTYRPRLEIKSCAARIAVCAAALCWSNTRRTRAWSVIPDWICSSISSNCESMSVNRVHAVSGS